MAMLLLLAVWLLCLSSATLAIYKALMDGAEEDGEDWEDDDETGVGHQEG